MSVPALIYPELTLNACSETDAADAARIFVTESTHVSVTNGTWFATLGTASPACSLRLDPKGPESDVALYDDPALVSFNARTCILQMSNHWAKNRHPHSVPQLFVQRRSSSPEVRRQSRTRLWRAELGLAVHMNAREIARTEKASALFCGVGHAGLSCPDGASSVGTLVSMCIGPATPGDTRFSIFFPIKQLAAVRRQSDSL
ncbi:hypothetical protein ACVWYQ_003583 [Bradyrhizobium sp. USDA 3397]